VFELPSSGTIAIGDGFLKTIKKNNCSGFFEAFEGYFENAAKRIMTNCRRAGSRQNKNTMLNNDINNKKL
jgi:hypothetical protein